MEWKYTVRGWKEGSYIYESGSRFLFVAVWKFIFMPNKPTVKFFIYSKET